MDEVPVSRFLSPAHWEIRRLGRINMLPSITSLNAVIPCFNADGEIAFLSGAGAAIEFRNDILIVIMKFISHIPQSFQSIFQLA